MADCRAYKRQIDGTDAVLACWLPEGHQGPHYDLEDDLSWQEGKLSAEARGAAGEAWAEGHYQPGVSDPADGGA